MRVFLVRFKVNCALCETCYEIVGKQVYDALDQCGLIEMLKTDKTNILPCAKCGGRTQEDETVKGP